MDNPQNEAEGQILVFKLTNGEEFIAKVTLETTENYVLDHPVRFQRVDQPGQPQPQTAMIPFMNYVNQDSATSITIAKSFIMCTGEPDEGLKGAWNQSYGSQIVLPEVPQLIT